MNKAGGFFLIGFSIIWMLIIAPMFLNVVQSPNAGIEIRLFFVPFIVVGIGVFIAGIVMLVRGGRSMAGTNPDRGENIPLVFLMPDGQIGVAGSNMVEITAEILRDGYSSGVSVLQDKTTNIIPLDNQTQIAIGVRKNEWNFRE